MKTRIDPSGENRKPFSDGQRIVGAGQDRDARALSATTVILDRAFGASIAAKGRLAELGSSVLTLSPTVRKLIADETERWSKVIQATDIKAE